MIARRNSAVRTKNILGDDVYGLWHVKNIVVHGGGQRYAVIPTKEVFSTRSDAEHYADVRVRRFIEQKLSHNHGTVGGAAVIKYLFGAAFISVMTALAVQWLRDQP